MHTAFPWTAWLPGLALLGLMRTEANKVSPMKNCCTGDVVRFGMIAFDYEPIVRWHGYVKSPQGDIPHFSGFIPDAVEMLAQEMGFKLEFHVVPCLPDPNYTVCLDDLVSRGVIDATFATAVGVHPGGIVETGALYESSQNILIQKIAKGGSHWQLFEPFTVEMWIGVLVSIFFASAVMIIMEAFASDNCKELCSPLFCLKALYHSWAAMLGGDDFEWSHWPGRIFRVGFLFLVLVLGATYTANLAAFLTMPSFELRGPQDLKALKDSTVCVLHSAVMQDMDGFVTKYVSPPNENTMPTNERLQFCNDQVQSGKADAIAEVDATLKKYMLDHCDKLQWIPTVTFCRMRWVLILKDAELAQKMSAVIAWTVMQPGYEEFVRNELFQGSSCPAPKSSNAQIELESMIGLFIIFGVVAGFALLTSIFQKVHRKFTGSPDGSAEGDPLASEADILRALLNKVDLIENKLGNGTQGDTPMILQKLETIEKLIPCDRTMI